MDDALFERWYADYGYAVHRRCLRLLQSEADADDALHEVFLRAHRYRHALAGESPLGWLYRIADRHCIDVLSRRTRHVRDVAPLLPEPAELPATETQYLFGQVLGACKPRVRDVALLYYVDEFTQDEVAERLGVSRKTVKEKLAQFKSVAARLLRGTMRGRRNVS